MEGDRVTQYILNKHKKHNINSYKLRKIADHFVSNRFTDFYNSQCITHFTATFIENRTNISIIEFNIQTCSVISKSWCIESLSYLFGLQSTMIKMKMILPQVHLRKPCYDFSFLEILRFTQLSAATFGIRTLPQSEVFTEKSTR